MRRRAEGTGSVGETAPLSAPRARFGLLGKITVFLVLVLVPVASASWIIAYPYPGLLGLAVLASAHA